MENGNDFFGYRSFATYSLWSRGSGHNNASPCEFETNHDLFSFSEPSDAEIEIDGIYVGVHRNILASRSNFFNELFKYDNESPKKEGKPRYLLSKLMPKRRIGYEAFVAVLSYMYTGKVMACPPEVSTCVDESCPHDACGPAIQSAVEMMYASSEFGITNLVLRVQRRLLNIVAKAFVEDVVPILMVAFHCDLKELLSHCTQRIAESDLDDIILEKELPYEIVNSVRSLRVKSKQEHDSLQVDSLNKKRIRNIQKALDINDIRLVKVLLKESEISFDAAFLLHYASAYCDPKTVIDVLELGNANVNLRNSRWYTVLHVAARRKEPSIIVELLKRGASVFDRTVDGRRAVTICRKLTCPKDFNKTEKQGQETNKDRMCIEILEMEMQRNLLAGNVSDSDITMDESCSSNASGPAIQYGVEMMYASSKFGIKDLVHSVQERNQLLSLENGNDVSSSLTFASPSILPNGTGHKYAAPCQVDTSRDLLSSSKLNSSLDKLVVDSEYGYSDAEIEINGISVGVHRYILALRSHFFCMLFKNDNQSSVKEGKPRYLMSKLIPQGRIGYEAFMAVLSYMYTGEVKACPPEVSTCVDESCAHDACGPVIQSAVEMMYASSSFGIGELVVVVQRHLLNFVSKAFVEDVIPILMVAFHCDLKELLSHCTRRIAVSDLDDIILEKEIPNDILNDVRSLRVDSKQEHDSSQVDLNKKRIIRKIHQALDSNDIELVKMLLIESEISLDAAFALHYASAYCNPKIVTEVLNLGNCNVNLRSSRGYTVLHVAARRKDPSIIVKLLSMGASVSDTTADGQTAVTISKRLTRSKDFNETQKQGQETNKDRLCIDVLQREMQRNPLAGNVSDSSMMVADDLHMRLLLLENRVAMARSLFPTEARLAMQIAHADSTSEFAGMSASKGSYGNFREVDLNQIPSEQAKRLRERLEALQKTVETGRRFFPSCSEVLDKLLEDDTLGPLLLEKGTVEERKMKQSRFTDIKADVMKAFYKDMAANNMAGFRAVSSSSSSPKGNGHKRKVRQKKA